jgi:hypothetical protein
VSALRNDVGVLEVARNIETSEYRGKPATLTRAAFGLGDTAACVASAGRGNIVGRVRL